MENQKEWLENFEQRFGRKPTLEEFTGAKANGFKLEETLTEPESKSPQEQWLKHFEAQNNRKPTAEEFVEAKQNSFLVQNAEEEVPTSEFLELTDSEVHESSENSENPLLTQEKLESDSEVIEQPENNFAALSLQERWLAYFEEVNGRKPNPTEFLVAKEANFSMADLEAEAQQDTEYLHIESTPEELWKEAFLEKMGRLPKIDEYSYAKRNDFSLKTLSSPDKNGEELQSLTDIVPKSNILAVDEPTDEITSKKGRKSKKAKKSKNSSSKKNKKVPIIVSSVIAFLMIVGLIAFGLIYYSKDNQLSRLKEALDSNNASQIAKLIKVDDANFKVNEKNLKPFVSYLAKNPAYAASLSQTVENDSAQKANSDVYVEQSGNQLLFFPRYVLKMNLIYPTIDVAKKGTTVNFAGKDLGKTSEDNTILKPGVYAPGSYSLDGNYVLNGQTLANNRTVNLTRFSHSDFTQDLNLEFKFTTPTVRCNSFPDAEVWVDGKKVGQLENGLLRLPEMAYSSGMEIYLKKPFPSKTLESNHVKLTEGQPDITMDFTIYSGNISDYKTIVNNFLSQYYKAEAGVTQNSKLIDYLENGTSTPQYTDFIGNHFAKIKAQNDAYNSASYEQIKANNLYEFDGYYYKYNQDADISLVDISNNELVFNVNFSETQYWNMYSSASSNGSTDGDGYQNFHWTGRQIIIDSGQAKSLLNDSTNYNSSTGYIKIRSFGTVKGDDAVNDPNIDWSSLY
ncbi:MAG: hypothetical protein LBI13_09510 [Streptococcaceae bacterium]|jgi:uncharacterized membrane protein YvbJ|nr:hypothetical protein [Streptococcaceae bacterium]